MRGGGDLKPISIVSGVEKDLKACNYSDRLHHKITGLFKKKRAFTLAEILITLGIIGIVAALTLPALISNYRKNVAETRLKHFYSTINQAIKSAEADYGDVTQWDHYTQDFKYDDYKAWLDKYLLPYIKTTKVENCMHEYACLYFPNGSMLLIAFDNVAFYPVAESNSKTKIRGKDCFSFNLAPVSQHTPLASGKGFEPYIGSYSGNYNTLYTHSVYGCKSTKATCSSSIDANMNKYCTRIIQENGWKIPDNYPLRF